VRYYAIFRRPGRPAAPATEAFPPGVLASDGVLCYASLVTATQVSRRGAPVTETVTSRDNRWLKRFRAALRDAEADSQAAVGLEGPHLVADALQAGHPLVAVLCSESGQRHLAPLLSRVHPETRILRTSDRLFAAVSGTRAPQGLAALARLTPATLDDLLSSRAGCAPLLAALAGVQDPGNVGTVLRTAEAFGASGVVALPGTANPWGQKSLRASSGSALRLPILTGVAQAIVLAQLRIAGLRLVAACATQGAAPRDADLRGPVALLIGNEGAGLPPELERSADTRVRIPVAAPVESLNAAVAAAVLLYEASRQRAKA
jgi:TrmH family RNA methyltransferase